MGTEKNAAGPRGTLLVVDDEGGPRDSLRIVFKDRYHVVTATNGAEALQYAASQPVDVVILDILMPDISGTEVLRQLKQRDPQLEVIMLTGHETIESAKAAVRHGAADYLSKPWDVNEVRGIVAKCFEKRRRAQDAATRKAGTDETEKSLRQAAQKLAHRLASDQTRPAGAARRGAPAAADSPIHWREYGMILLERKWITITAVVAVVMLTLLWNLRATPIYRATTRLQADAESARVLNIQEVVASDARDSQYLNTQLKLLQSRVLAERAVKAMSLDQSREFIPKSTPRTDFALELQGCLSAELVRESRLIDISIEHPNAEVAARLANGVAAEYIRLDQKLNPSLEAAHWLRQQADEYKLKVEKSEAALQEYREKTRAVSLEDHQNIVVARLQELSSAVTKAKTDRLAAEIEWNKVRKLLEDKQDLVTIAAIATDPQVSALRQQLTTKQIAVTTLRERYGEKHPTMIAALTELHETKVKLTQVCQYAAETLQTTYLTSQAKEEILAQALTEQEQESLALSRQMIEYTALKRNAEADKQLYESILTRLKEAGITGTLDLNNIRVIDRAELPKAPCKPRKLRNLLLSTVAGLVLGLGLSFTAHLYDDKIKSFDDVETFLGLPLLSTVPAIAMAEAAERGMVVHRDSHSLPAEAFRNLRASLTLSPAGRDAQTLLITSTAPGESKSLVAANLAIVLANNNQRTLLIDADLRHPVQHKMFGITVETGLSALLTGSATLTDVARPSGVPQLDVICVGQVPAHAAELLGSARWRELLAEAGQYYDRVIVDSPPVTAVSDPLIILPQVDGVIFVVHFSKIRRDLVSRAARKVQEGGVPVIGAVLNNINTQAKGYYYYPYHYSHYYQRHPDKEKTAAESRT